MKRLVYIMLWLIVFFILNGSKCKPKTPSTISKIINIQYIGCNPSPNDQIQFTINVFVLDNGVSSAFGSTHLRTSPPDGSHVSQSGILVPTDRNFKSMFLQNKRIVLPILFVALVASE